LVGQIALSLLKKGITMRKYLLPPLIALMLSIGACTIALPTAPEIEENDELCELFITLEVVRLGTTGEYWSNELDIFDNRLGLDCRRVAIREEWFRVGDNVSWLLVYETWDCYSCPDTVVDGTNREARSYRIALPKQDS